MLTSSQIDQFVELKGCAPERASLPTVLLAPRRLFEGRLTEPETETIPLVEEEIVVSKRELETGRVRVRTETHWETGRARADLFRDHVEVERVAIGREVDAVPTIRDDGDTVIVPVVEEILVVEKRLFLKEEVHLKRVRTVARMDEPVRLRVQRAVVEREDISPDNPEENLR